MLAIKPTYDKNRLADAFKLSIEKKTIDKLVQLAISEIFDNQGENTDEK